MFSFLCLFPIGLNESVESYVDPVRGTLRNSFGYLENKKFLLWMTRCVNVRFAAFSVLSKNKLGEKEAVTQRMTDGKKILPFRLITGVSQKTSFTA